jgi:hypothetical protein
MKHDLFKSALIIPYLILIGLIRDVDVDDEENKIDDDVNNSGKNL